MAFQTIRGEAGVDFIGTANVDALFSLNESGIKTVDALAGNDTVDMTDESGVVGTAEVKLGEGNDTFTMGANSTTTNRLSGSTVNGGPGNDNISTEGTLTSKLRGNEGNDDFNLESNYTNTTINGNAGVDSFTLTGATTLSDTKILGGADNDGQMDFSGAALVAVDSVIQGGKGLDTITIGDVNAGVTNFRVSGGADNDTINVNNTTAAADGIAYNGADGDDAINFFDTNAADAVTKGGEGVDRFTFGSGNGALNASGEAGNDFFNLNTGVATVGGFTGTAGTRTAVTAANTTALDGGKMTVNGGLGADTYSLESVLPTADDGNDDNNAASNGIGSEVYDRAAVQITIASVADSAATLTGSTATFDGFSTATAAVDRTVANAGAANQAVNQVAAFGLGGVNNTAFGDIIDMRGTGEELVGNRLNADEVTNNGTVIADAGYGSFAALKTALDGNLTASVSNVGGTNTGSISLEMVEVTTNTVATGYYAIFNNTNRILDSGDVMIKMATPGGNDGAAATELAEIAAAVEAGFAL